MHAPDSSQWLLQLLWLAVLAIPVSCIAWTFTKEDLFKELRDYFQRCSKSCSNIVQRKFFYLFTCEYCFSHYIAGLFLVITGYKLLLDDWRGYLLSFFALVWVANVYMSLYSHVRASLRVEKAEAEVIEAEKQAMQPQINGRQRPKRRPGRHEDQPRERVS